MASVRVPKGGPKRVPVPRNNPAGRVRPPLGMPHAPIMKATLKPKKGQRQYSKIAVPDPSQAQDQWANSGFGNTGMYPVGR